MTHWKKWVLIGLALSVLVSWLFYRSAYLADVVYVYYRTLNFKTGQQCSIVKERAERSFG